MGFTDRPPVHLRRERSQTVILRSCPAKVLSGGGAMSGTYEVRAEGVFRRFTVRREAFCYARELARETGWAEVKDVITGELFPQHTTGPCTASPEAKLLAAIFNRPCCERAS